MADIKSARRTSSRPPQPHQGHQAGQLEGQLRAPEGPSARRPLDGRALDRDQREGREPDRPVDAEPLAGLGARRGRRPRPSPSRRAPRPSWPSACSTPRACRTPRCRRWPSRCRSRAPAASRSGRSCSTCRSRSARGGGPTTSASRRGCSSCSGPRRTGGRRCARCCGRARRASCPPFTGTTVVDLPRRLQLRPRGRRVALLRRAAGRRGAARVPVQRRGLLRRPGRRAADRAHLLGAGGAYRLPVAVWRETIDGHFPGTAWLRLRPGQLRAPARLQGPPRAGDAGRTRWTRCWRGGGALTVDEVRRIADAVLYEGYLLWPYRRSALKNQRRWTFGGVYPEAHSRGRDDDPWTMRTQCLLEAGGERARRSTWACASCTSSSAGCSARRRTGSRTWTS